MGKVLKIREVGDPILSQVSKEVDVKNINHEILDTIDDLKETLNFGTGLGISAPQIGVNKRIIVVGAKKENINYNDAVEIPIAAMINPSWKKLSNDVDIQFEGCMSVPSIRGKVERYKSIELTYYNEKGEKIIKQINGFFARLVQHECDHLDGIVFLEKVKGPNGFSTKENIIKYDLRKTDDIEKYMRNINKDLKKYIETNIFPQYEKNNIGGHGIDHIKYVIKRSFEIISEFNLEVDSNIVYTVAAYHDLGYKIEPENHEIVSSKLFKEDKNIRKFFNESQIDIIADAITDHRASLKYEARNIYGKIVSSADRNISVDTTLKRSILYYITKYGKENSKIDNIINDSFNKLSKKYGKGGYAKMYYPDKKYIEFNTAMNDLIENKDEFIRKEKEIIKSLD